MLQLTVFAFITLEVSWLHFLFVVDEIPKIKINCKFSYTKLQRNERGKSN